MAKPGGCQRGAEYRNQRGKMEGRCGRRIGGELCSSSAVTGIASSGLVAVVLRARLKPDILVCHSVSHALKVVYLPAFRILDQPGGEVFYVPDAAKQNHSRRDRAGVVGR